MAPDAAARAIGAPRLITARRILAACALSGVLAGCLPAPTVPPPPVIAYFITPTPDAFLATETALAAPPTPTPTRAPPTVAPEEVAVAPAASIAAFVPPAIFQRGDTRPAPLKALTSAWATDWTTHSVDYEELQSGGVARDGIPALDNPKTESIADADRWLNDREPVIALFFGESARAYPLQILTWHEIANDVVGGVPVAVTYCPLCNAALVYDRRVHHAVVDFGVSGLLRNSDLVMYDRQTESLWQQLEGRAIVGHLTGTQLQLMPSLLISWRDFKSTFPKGDVVSRTTGRSRPYGENPYAGYDTATQPFLFRGVPDDRLPPVERVVAVEEGDDVVAYPFRELAAVGAANDVVGGVPVVVLWQSGTASALDAPKIEAGRDVGAAGVFDRRLAQATGAPRGAAAGVQELTFQRTPAGDFEDAETGSTWSLTGRATAGPLEGTELALVFHGNEFWFAWAAFRPETRVWAAPPLP